MKTAVDLKNAFDQFFKKDIKLDELHNVITDVKQEDLIKFINTNKDLRKQNDDPLIKKRLTEEIQVIKNFMPALDS